MLVFVVVEIVDVEIDVVGVSIGWHSFVLRSFEHVCETRQTTPDFVLLFLLLPQHTGWMGKF